MIIGNLWDVTDKDLDNLSVTYMTRVFEAYVNLEANAVKSATTNNTIKPPLKRSLKSGKGTRDVDSHDHSEDDVKKIRESFKLLLWHGLNDAKEYCKMKYAVGSAAVIYGMPDPHMDCEMIT
jgi:hypothetical protein